MVPGPPASEDEARLLEWELIVPTDDDVEAAAESLRRSGSSVETRENGAVIGDPWGTRMYIRAAR